MTEEAPSTIEASDITEEQLTEYVKTLRNERINLYKLVRSFLDLPPAPVKHLLDRMLEGMGTATRSQTFKGKDLAEPTSPYAETGPPKTHPSAGLAYSRSSQYLYNHPVWGPQKSKPPVKARVVMPRGAATGSFAPALGVGGFVTDVPTGSFNPDAGPGRFKNSPKPVIPGVLNIEPEKVGGSKVYVQPTHARVDPKGRVILSVVGADQDAVAVLEGNTENIPVPPQSPIGPSVVNRSTGFSSVRNDESRGYGLNFSGEAPPRPQSESPTPTPSPMTAEAATKALTDLINGQG
jgi:Mitochondrial ribosomal protein subunit